MSREFTMTGRFKAFKRTTDGQERLLDDEQSVSIIRDLVGAPNGPLPGSLLVPITSAGLDVDLSLLTAPGVCRFHHQGLADGTDPGTSRTMYYVDVGIRDVITGLVYPLLELVPGDKFAVPLSRNLLESYNLTGTGTGPPVNKLHLIAHVAPCRVFVGAFER